MGRKRKQAKADLPPPPRFEEVDDEEQWRIINESGVLKGTRVLRRNDDGEPDENENEAEEVGMPERIMDAVFIVIPLCFLYLLMDILVHQQYGMQPTVLEEAGRTLKAAPVIFSMVFFSQPHKSKRIAQLLMFIISIASGVRLIHIVNRSSWRIVMRQGPPLATIWVFVIVQLNLSPAVLSLIVVGGLIRFLKLKIIL